MKCQLCDQEATWIVVHAHDPEAKSPYLRCVTCTPYAGNHTLIRTSSPRAPMYIARIVANRLQERLDP